VAGNKVKYETKTVDDKEHQNVIDTIRGRTMEMSYTVHGLPKSRRIGGKLADTMAASVKGKTKGVRSSWSMFTSDHPLVKELNATIQELKQLRDTWTIVKSAEVKTGNDDKVTIEDGKRLIWDKDVAEFYNLFVQIAKRIDAVVVKLQYAVNNSTTDANGNVVLSVKDMDKANAGDAWDESVYPKDLTLVVGVAKDRNPDGSAALDKDGNPKYIIKFEEYHVSEKLPQLLRERAIRRIDEGLSGTIETAMSYAVNELTESMTTFLNELVPQTKVFPSAKGSLHFLYGAVVTKILRQADDAAIPFGHLKVCLRYEEDKTIPGVIQADTKSKVTKWFGPFLEKDFITNFKPEVTEEKKKIFPTVIEGIITQLQAFREKKAKMLGVYGENLVATFEPLLEMLTKAKEDNAWYSNGTAAKKLAEVLRTDDEVKTLVSKTIKDTIETLEEQVVVVKTVHKRRGIKASLIGNV